MGYNFSENVQRGIIYLLKNDIEFFSEIVNLIQPEYFELTLHSKIFNAIKDYYEKYLSLPPKDLFIEHLKTYLGSKENITDYIDELDYIDNVDSDTIENKEFILDLVEKFAKKEAMKAAISESIVLIKNGQVEAVEALVRKALLVNRNIDTGQDYFNDYKERWSRSSVSKGGNMQLFLSELNRNLEGGGLSRKELAMAAAPPGGGKSVFLANQTVYSLTQGYNVLYVSLEMSEDKIAQRIDSITTLVPQSKLKIPSEQNVVSNRLNLFKQKFPKGRLIIKEFPCTQANSNTIRNLIHQLKTHEDFVPDVLVVDYLELLRPVREIQQEHLAQERIAQELRGLSTEFNCLVFTATQTNRLGKTVKIITSAEFGDSFGKTRPADYIITLNQNEEEFNNGLMRVWVDKARNGKARFIIPIRFDTNTLSMKEISKHKETHEL